MTVVTFETGSSGLFRLALIILIAYRQAFAPTLPYDFLHFKKLNYCLLPKVLYKDLSSISAPNFKIKGHELMTQ
jgi:hypothetical protein